MKERVIIIEQAAKEYHYLIKRGERTNRYSKDKNYSKKLKLAGQVADKYSVNKAFFEELVCSPNF